MNSLRETGQKNSGRTLSGMLFYLNFLLMLGAIILSWIFLKEVSTANGLLTMCLWVVTILIASLSMVFAGSRFPMIGIGSFAVLLLGLIIAFLGGDKFDTIRAAVIFIVMMILYYRRERQAVSAV